MPCVSKACTYDNHSHSDSYPIDQFPPYVQYYYASHVWRFYGPAVFVSMPYLCSSLPLANFSEAFAPHIAAAIKAILPLTSAPWNPRNVSIKQAENAMNVLLQLTSLFILYLLTKPTRRAFLPPLHLKRLLRMIQHVAYVALRANHFAGLPWFINWSRAFCLSSSCSNCLT